MHIVQIALLTFFLFDMLSSATKLFGCFWLPCFTLYLKYNIVYNLCQFGILHKYYGYFLYILYKVYKRVKRKRMKRKKRKRKRRNERKRKEKGKEYLLFYIETKIIFCFYIEGKEKRKTNENNIFVSESKISIKIYRYKNIDKYINKKESIRIYR